MTITVLDTYRRATALRRAPETVPCRRCHADRGDRCCTPSGGWLHGTYHQTRWDDIGHLDDQQRLDAVAALDAERETVRQATTAQLDAARPANRWTELDRKETR